MVSTSVDPSKPAEGVTTIYTDGACSGNPGPGGWAWATTDGREGAGGEADTTNQRMELTAVLEALEAISGRVDVFSDSTYVVNCFNDRWYEGWVARNWRNSQRKPVANRDLWEPLVEIFERRRDELTFTWVKGHSGDRMNDHVDALAVAQIEQFRAGGEAGRPAENAGQPDGGPEVVPWPVERAMVVTGSNQMGSELSQELEAVMARLDPGFDVVVSGLRRGAELTGAELAVQRRVPLAVVLPFDDPAARWPAPDRARFDACVSVAEWTVVLAGDPARPGQAVAQRNAWIRGAVVGAIVVDDPALSADLDGHGLAVIEVTAEEAVTSRRSNASAGRTSGRRPGS